MASRMTQSHVVGESMIHIAEPVASQVLQYVIERLGYFDLFKENIELVSDFRTTTKTKDKDGNALLRRNRVKAKLNPNVNPFNNKWEGNGTTVDLGNGNTLVTRAGGNATKTPWGVSQFPDQRVSIFSDTDEFIDLTERMVGSTLSMEVSMDFTNVVDANECLSRIYQCFVNGDMTGYVDVQYDYPLPMAVQKTLRHLYELRGPRSTDDTCWKWISDGSKNMITALVNRNNPKHKEVVVNKNNFQALYLLECSMDAPTPLDPNGGTVNLTITVQYARSNRIVLQYPVIVGNQYVSADYIPMDPELRQGATPSPIMWQNPNVTKLWEAQYASGKCPPVHYPWWDNWELPVDSRINRQGYVPKVEIAFTLDDFNNPTGTTTIDLKEGLPGMKLSQEILDVIASKKNAVLDIMNVVNVSVFADDYLVDKSLLDLSDGRHLIVKKRRGQSVCRLVVGVRQDKTVDKYTWNRVWKVTFFPTKDPVPALPQVPPYVKYIKKGELAYGVHA